MLPRLAMITILSCVLAGCGGTAASSGGGRTSGDAAPAAAPPSGAPVPAAPVTESGTETRPMGDKTEKSEAEWRKQLTPEQYRVLREKGTERAFTGKYWNTKTAGTYRCAGCGRKLFVSDAKFDSGCGWPSFFEPVDARSLVEHEDLTHGMVRTEVTCGGCGGHLGHVFPDGPPPTGLRYCINSASIELAPEEKK